MKYMGVAEAKAKFSECLDQAQAEPVVILSHGKPVGLLVGVEGLKLEQVAGQPSLVHLLAERAKETTFPWKSVRKELLRSTAKRRRK